MRLIKAVLSISLLVWTSQALQCALPGRLEFLVLVDVCTDFRTKFLTYVQDPTTQVIEQLNTYYRGIRVAAASFVDKPMPAISAGAFGGWTESLYDWCLRSELEFTTNMSDINQFVDDLASIRGVGLSDKNGVLEALVAAVYSRDSIQWTSEGRNILAITSELPNIYDSIPAKRHVDAFNAPVSCKQDGSTIGGFGAMESGQTFANADWQWHNYHTLDDEYNTFQELTRQVVCFDDSSEEVLSQLEELKVLLAPTTYPEPRSFSAEQVVNDSQEACRHHEYPTYEQAGDAIVNTDTNVVALVLSEDPDTLQRAEYILWYAFERGKTFSSYPDQVDGYVASIVSQFIDMNGPVCECADIADQCLDVECSETTESVDSHATCMLSCLTVTYTAGCPETELCIDLSAAQTTDLPVYLSYLTDCIHNNVLPPTPEPPSTEAPSTEAPSTEAPSTEAPSTEAPSTEAPSTEAPSTEAPSTEAPSTEAPSTEAPSTEPPSTEAPSTEAPSTEAPSTEAPSTEAPSTEAPSTEAPSTEAPSTEAPSTEAPSTEAPSTEAPSTEAPSTEAPSTEAPSTVAIGTGALSTEASSAETASMSSTELTSFATEPLSSIEGTQEPFTIISTAVHSTETEATAFGTSAPSQTDILATTLSESTAATSGAPTFASVDTEMTTPSQPSATELPPASIFSTNSDPSNSNDVSFGSALPSGPTQPGTSFSALSTNSPLASAPLSAHVSELKTYLPTGSSPVIVPGGGPNPQPHVEIALTIAGVAAAATLLGWLLAGWCRPEPTPAFRPVIDVELYDQQTPPREARMSFRELQFA